jgi:1-hydroxycarotenoid 3,4-desaturase
LAQPHAVVIGAGVGGLSAAATLAAQGLRVTVLERAAAPGGKMRELAAGGAVMDAGPTVFTMRWVFDELFAACGASLADRLTLIPTDLLARHGWTDGARFDLWADPARSADAVAAFAGPDEARRFTAFAARAARVYRALERPFIAGQKPGMAELLGRLGLSRLPALMETTPFQSMAAALARSLGDPRLRQLFGRYATYCGSSPYAAPATLMLVAHVELEGVWLVEGGMHRLARALETLGAEHGAAFRYGAHVAEVEVGRAGAEAVRLASGERIAADAVVFNGDVGALAAGLLGEGARAACPPVPRRERSISALVWSANAETADFPLDRHNVFFRAGDYAEEFRAIFDRRTVCAEPSVYVCAQDRGPGMPAPDGPERLHVHVNAPADGDLAAMSPQEIERCRIATQCLMARCGLTLELTPANSVLTDPTGFEALFPATGGALFGRATHGAFGTFRRPGARTRVPGLYAAGGSAHPGPGVPMAAMSGRLAAAALLADLQARPRASTPPDSTRPARPAATSGGMSTGSATTAATGSR